MHRAIRRILFLFPVLFWVGCAHLPPGKEHDPAYLIQNACEPGSTVKSVKGSVWLKVQSQEANGQFPAWVNAQSPDLLKLEVTNLLGGTEAKVSVDRKHVTIQVPGKEGRPEQHFNSGGSAGVWGGIPLNWASDLFLGRIPCPSHEELARAHLEVGSEGELTVELGDAKPERFVYQFRSWESRPWPESLHWERKGSSPLTVNFKFDDPEDGTHSPRKWEAKSPLGEVKTRWRDRDVSR